LQSSSRIRRLFHFSYTKFDVNSNKISIQYNGLGDIALITDTLGRIINFNYDGNNNLQTITQSWLRDSAGGQVSEIHYWATFGYGLTYVASNFSGLAVEGPNGQNINTLTQVGLPDGSLYTFQYNSYGQVWKITHQAPMGNPPPYYPRNYVSYDLTSSTTDCPRISARHDWAADWLGNSYPWTTSNEAVTNFTTGTSGQLTEPDGTTVYKEYYGTGWQSGLLNLAEWWSGGSRQKWTTAQWTQDNTNVSYLTSPRPLETNIYDASGNRRRSTVSYNTFPLPSGANCTLPSDVSEYAADAATVLRRTHTDYITDTAYLNLGFIGLPSGRLLYDAAGAAKSNTLFRYDWASHLQAMPGGVNPPQHDANYNTTFLTRGNLVSVQRISTDPNDPPNTNTEFKWGYDVSGSVAFTRDALWHQNFFDYTDSFSDGNNGRNTFAYPTTATDADGYQSLVKYNFDMGVAVRAQGPPPQGYTQGAAQDTYFEVAGRVEKVKNEVSNAYKSFSYGINYALSNASVNNVADEALSLQYFDGDGRVFASLTNHPGSVGGYSGQYTTYDNMGRLSTQSNPTEINGSWVPTGDDSAWLYTQQTYDWKGRPLLTTQTDGTYRSVSYTGCGCAGGEVATLTDEGTMVAGALQHRTQKIYSDVLGRTAKTEVYNWDGSVYTTTSNTFNALDHVTLVRQFQGPDSSSVYQDTTMAYDGFGRLQTKHLPQQQVDPNNSASTDHTTYGYNSDDTLYSVTDGRGASASYGYNGRNLVTSITYAVPAGSSIPVTANVSFGYDAAGNRTSMSDGSGSCSYSYDQLSRMVSETHHFNDLAGASTGGNYTIGYQYNLVGQVTSVSDPNDRSRDASYVYDSAARVTNINGAGYGGISAFANGIQYRAWGATKHVGYGNGLSADLQYNNRLQATQYLLTKSGATVIGVQYQYTTSTTSADNDGRLKFSHDLTDSSLDRTYTFDQAGQLSGGYAGSYLANSNVTSGPYQEGFSNDVWGNLVGRTWRQYQYFSPPGIWGPETYSYGENYVNNRSTNPGWSYDADGRMVTSKSAVNPNYTQTNSYDAAGQMLSSSVPGTNYSMAYDGNGQRVKFVQNGHSTYYVISSVVGQAISELDQSGLKRRSYVYARTQVVAKQEGNAVQWDNRDASGRSTRMTDSGGNVASRVELDPLSVAVDPTNVPQGNSPYVYNPVGFYGTPQEPDEGCSLGGLPMDCAEATRLHNDECQLFPDRCQELIIGNPWSVDNMLKQLSVDQGLPPPPSSTAPYQSGGNGASASNGTVDLGGSWQIVDEWDDTGDSDVDLEGTEDSSVTVRAKITHRLEFVPGHTLLVATLRQNPSEPQGTFDKAYADCKGQLGKSVAPGLAQAADILMVANRTGVDPTLLSVTWRFEGGYDQFGFNFQPTNGMHTPDVQMGDVGPGQLYPDTWNKSPYTDGLTNPFGTNLNRGQVFNGNAFENLMVAGRALGTARGAQRANAAGLYRAGSSTNPGYKERVQNFKDNVKNYDAFFGCLAKKGFSP
jgi:YD repeat-containing protein